MKGPIENREELYSQIFSELKTLGVKVPKLKKFKASMFKQEKAVQVSNQKIFGACLSDQEKVSVDDFLLPKFIVASTSYLKKFCHKEIGLFRKAGSIPRQKDLRAKLERGGSIGNSEPNDVASLLKQWLRELPEPLIPCYLHEIFLKCQSLDEEEAKVAAVLLCCHLLPLDHLVTLRHLLEFLSEIASHSDKNKMGVHNLALIMAPNIFIIGSDSIDKASRNLMQQHVSILELLIIHAQRVGESPPSLSSPSMESFGAELEVSIEVLDCSPSRSKKKRTSDVFSGFRKLVSQNSSPPSSANQLLEVPGCSKTVSRSASKRKADPEVVMSPAKKSKNSTSVFSFDILNMTPNTKSSQNVIGILKEKAVKNHVRRQSFGLLKRRKEKRVKSSNSRPEQPKVSASVSSPFHAQHPVSPENCFEAKAPAASMSSPLLSDSDIDRILSRTSFVKKSLSDCQLTSEKDNLSSATFASQGYLNSTKNASPYNLRSSSNIERPLKRKSNDILPIGTFSAEDKENESPYLSFGSGRKIRRLGSSPKPEFVKRGSFSSKNKNVKPDLQNPCNREACVTIGCQDPDAGNHNVSSSHLPAALSPSFSRGSRKRISYRKRRNPALPADSEAENTVNATTGGKISIKDSKMVAGAQNPTVLNRKNEKVAHVSSISRQDAFIFKPQQSKRAVVPQVESCPIQVSSVSRSVTDSEQSGQKEIETTPENRKLRRNLRNGSIIRGRPNTVWTGLPKSASRRANGSSASFKVKPSIASTISVKDALINVKSPSLNDLDLSITAEIQKMVLSSPPDSGLKSKAVDAQTASESVSQEIKTVMDGKAQDRTQNTLSSNLEDRSHTAAQVANESVSENNETDVDIKDEENKNLSKGPANNSFSQDLKQNSNTKAEDNKEKFKGYQSGGEISSHSDSEMLPTRKKSLKVARNHSFPDRPRRSKSRSKLHPVGSSSLRKCMSTSCESGKEHIFSSISVPQLPANENEDHPIQNSEAPKKVEEELVQMINLGTENKKSTVVCVCDGSAEAITNEDQNCDAFPEVSEKTNTDDEKAETIKAESESGTASISSSEEGRTSSKDSFASWRNLKTKKAATASSTASVSSSQEGKTSSKDSFSSSWLATPEVWVTGEAFLSAEEQAFQDEAFTKRDSIAMIVRNNPGHVLAKVSIFDCNRSRGSACHTPVMASSSTPNQMLRGTHHSSMKQRLSQQRSASSSKPGKSTGPKTSSSMPRSRGRFANLPPPPKFIIPDSNPPSPIASFPLRELTNISNGEEMSLNLSPIKMLATPLKGDSSPAEAKKSMSVEDLIPATLSFSGRTPLKVVIRSESSPVLVRAKEKLPRNLSHGNNRKSPVAMATRSCAKSVSRSNSFKSPTMVTRSALSLQKIEV